MKLLEFSYKNILSYGNLLQTFKFKDEAQLILVEGENGSGKCLSKDTIIEIKIDDPIVREKFIAFMKNKQKLFA